MWETLVIVSVILVYFFTRNQKKEPEEDTEKEIEEEKEDVEDTEDYGALIDINISFTPIPKNDLMIWKKVWKMKEKYLMRGYGMLTV